jgi:hypothetical protein
MVAALTASSVGTGTAGAHTDPATAPSAASPGPAPTLLLQEQSAWVGPGQSFDLRLRTHTAVPADQLGLSIGVDACLSSVSGFDQSVGSASPSSGEVSSTQKPLPIDPLLSPDGEIDLSMKVSLGADAATTATAVDLPPSNAECGAYPSGGVFPIRVQLVDTSSGQVIGGLTTHLIYADTASGTQKLLVALVLPLRATVGPATAPTSRQLRRRPSAALASPSPAAVADVTGTVDAIASNPHVPITLEASPQTIAGLAASDTTKAAVAQLAALASAPAPYADQFASAPYTPVNASELVAAGLADELTSQVSLGTGILSTQVTHAPAAPAAGGPAADLGPWITDDSLDTAALTQLQSDGYSQVVLPAGSVSSTPSNGSTTEPFGVVTGRGSPMTVVASSADLAARFNGAPGNPVLAAHQLVAELAQIYFEKPNDITPRATVVAAPTSWADDPTFVRALLSALAANPIIQPVTTSQLFAAIPAATCRSGCRLTGVASVGGLPVRAVRHQRQQIAGFASAATGTTARSLTDQMDQVVLSAESEALRPAQQSAVLRNAGLAVAAQLGQLTVSGDRTVTLTSQQGTLQVTIVSTAPYPVTASLTLTSDKLLFPNGTTQYSERATLLPAVSGTAHTNVVPVAVRARTSGVFNVDVVMHSPVHQLELASGQMSVRSTATSVVGIILSVGALAVLAVWWVRTSLRRRRTRRSDASAGLAGVG